MKEVMVSVLSRIGMQGGSHIDIGSLPDFCKKEKIIKYSPRYE